MDILKMSKNEKGKDFMKKSAKIRLVTKMLTKIFFVEKKCYDKILYFFSGNSYRIFLLAYIKENG